MFSFGKKGSAARNASAAAADLNSVESDVISELGLSSDPVTSPMARNRKTVLYRGGSSRKNLGDPHVNIKALGESRLGHLVSRRRARQRYMNKLMQKGTLKEQQQGDEEAKTPDDSEVISRPSKFDASARITSASSSTYSVEELTEDEKEQMKQTSEGLMLIKNVHKNYASLMSEIPIEIRMSNFTFVAPFTEASSKIKTVYNSSFVYQVVKLFKRLREGTLGAPKEEVHNQIVLDKINLSLKPGKMYLLLGPPASGKSSLLKAIAGRLRHSKKNGVSGVVTYNGKSFADKTEIHIDNAISMIDQLDRHAPRYTVEETFNFAFQCKRHNGHHVDFRFTPDTPENRKAGKAADDENLVVDTTIKALGLDHVRNTFVGNEEIRGVSGGQRRRVTIGEMLVGTAPILCGDEISNGLDATSTFDIMNILMHTGKIRRKLQVISLLQPSPETVSLFDEIILLGEGKILFAGPISQVEDYFAALGYVAPVHMDVCDFLQIVATPNGSELYDPSPELAAMRSSPYTLDELAAEFQKSRFGQNIRSEIGTAHRQVFGSAHGDLSKVEDAEYLDDRHFQEKFANSFPRSMWLNLKRQLTLWRRDKRVLIANAVKNIIMGISVGGVFFQTDDVVSILGVLFQGMLFVMLGGMVSAPAFVDERLVYYKQTDANFFGAFSFVIAKATSKVPQTAMDCINFGTILYYMVGLAPQASYFFTFVGVVFVFNVLMTELLFVFSTFAATKALVQVASACLVFFFMLFCGFIIAPNTIPHYYSWIYWYNPLAWAYRALIVNEFTSTKYSREQGEGILEFAGFVDRNGDPFTRDWILYGFIFMLGHIFLSLFTSAMILHFVRVTGESPPSFEAVEQAGQELEGNMDNTRAENDSDVNIPFKPITLSFENICYDVKSSKGDETLRLLHNVNGYFKAGRMCALMGESGAGKTTLMDVIALRKNSGTILGDVYVNGFRQDHSTFRRCSGYVEQFGIQSPQLTVRETVLFSTRLRLDDSKVTSEDKKKRFCDIVLKLLELTPLADSLVGSDEEGGLSFEQKKRLSIAVEMAASPSILFLDEPTTGLDSRSAELVVKLLRKIADQGRTICATIHQPSSAVFGMFDDLLLLKKGGYSVYFGPLGLDSQALIDYFEGQGVCPIEPGDNPANWMLRELPKGEKDYADLYQESPEHSTLKRQLETARTDPPKELEIWYQSDFAVPTSERQRLMNKRLQTIYWRSPTYNLSRLLVCIIIAFILGSVFITQRQLTTLTESELRAYFSVTFLSFIIIGILCITSVLPVMLAIRDVFYKQRAAGMVDNTALGWALGTAEKWFMILCSFLFCLVYLSVAGTFPMTIRRAIKFWGFFTFNLAIYSYFGQAFMCLVPAMATAQILSSVFIGLNNFFSGLIVRPQYMTGLFAFTYWITPGHYVYEGLIIAQYWGDERPVLATENSEFWDFLGCEELDPSEDCYGSVTQYLWVFFGGKYNIDNELQDIFVLALFLVIARVSTFFALKAFNYTNT